MPKQGREARELLRWETGVSAAGYSYSISGSIRAVTTGSGTEPSSSTASWNARMLNLKLARDFTLITRTTPCFRQLPSCVAVYPRD